MSPGCHFGGPVLTSLSDVTPAVHGGFRASGEDTSLVCQTDRLDVLAESDVRVHFKHCLVVTPPPVTRDGSE